MRTRITVAVAVLVGLALTGAGLIVFLVESRRIEGQISQGIDREFQELVKLSTPRRGDLVTSDVETLLRTFLERNLPDDSELLVAWWDDAPRLRSSRDDLVESQRFLAAVPGLMATNGSTTVETPADGPVLIAVQSVREQGSGRSGALVVVIYLDRARAGLRETMRTYAVISVLSLLLVVALAARQSGRLLAPLRTLRETTEAIGETDLSLRLPVSGNDDITAVTRTVNSMLDRLESAFVGQRQFLDDVGHELRTPLTILRGHLELIDVGAAGTVAETRDLLLEEVDRMARLVGDLILLAKSDRPDFVTPQLTDLGDLSVDVLAKARGLGDRLWLLDEVAASAIVSVDEQRLTQALLQLCDNAVRHTEAGDVVAVGSSFDGSSARMWVRDTGPGVPERQRGQIFERFTRGSAAMSGDGFGLGLSIVSAIALAHGGRVDVEDADPAGARFVITVPVRTGRGGETTWHAS